MAQKLQMDQNRGTIDCISSNMGVASNTQQSANDENPIKVRKPYTITKQRERWTQEEHNKFIDALKLYGRAWRRIEDHVGTKTAVQIRSHAQKFFSKVIREYNGDDAECVKPIEIPPPRPKRKPMHPYPRKLVIPLPALEKKENESPTSVLFGLDSEGQDSDISSPNASPSCVTSSIPIEPSPPKQEPYGLDDCYAQESPIESPTGQYLKLFGKLVLVTCSHRLSSPTKVHNPIPIKACPYNKDTEDKEELKERSSTCSNSESGNIGICVDKNLDNETQSGHHNLFEKIDSFSSFFEPTKRTKGFLPYKRCLAAIATHSPTITDEEREHQRTRLCL